MPLASRRNIKWGKSAIEGAGNPNFRGGRYIDDKGYIRVLKPEHPFNNKGYVYEHRLVMEAYLGRYLQPWETVHHINEVKLDNRIDNFYLTTVPEHSSIHREGKTHTKEHKEKLRENLKKRRRAERKEKSRKGGAEDR